MNYVRRRTLSTALLALVVILTGVWTGCGGDDTVERIANLSPSVRITGGPPEGREDSFTARVWWTGWDDDGIIANYEYAIDPPSAFTEAEIDAPETFPGIVRKVILGPEVGADTIRFTKVVDGVPHSFDFVQTRDFSRSFAFSTPQPDSGLIGSSTLEPLPRFSGVHALYIRCLDNDGAYSATDRLGYTAVTITPSSWFTRPRSLKEFLTVGTQFTARWDGLDPDSPEPNKKPVAFWYKLVRLNDLVPPITILGARNPNFILYRAAKHIPWVRRDADTASVSFLLEPGSYVLGVRAEDMAGAIEPYLDFVRGGEPGNVVALQVLPGAGVPSLAVTEPSLGTVVARGQSAFEFQVPVGQPLRFTWNASAEDYGGQVEGYNYGVNIPDLTREGPNSGWRGWSTLPGNIEPIVFKKAGINVVYIRARDVSGSETLCILVLDVIEFTLDREILVVDDYKDGVWPRDDAHDAFWTTLLEDSERFDASDLLPDASRFGAHGTDDTQFFRPVAPKLDQLGRYKMIVWETKGGGSDGSNALLKAGPVNRHLGAYLRSGGKLWVTGEMTVASTIPTQTDLADFSYPHEINPGMFAWEFFKLYSARIENPRYADLDIHGLLNVRPYPGLPEIFPPMAVDPEKQRPGIGGKFGLGGTDCIFDPIFEGDDPRFRGQIDSLYVYSHIGQLKGRGSPYNNKLCATRYHDPDPDRQQGRVIWFGFSMYYLLTEQAQETFNRAIDWLREESLPDR